MGHTEKVRAARRIACLSLLAKTSVYSVACNLPKGPLIWDVLPIEPNLEIIKDKLHQALADYDAVALEGLAGTFRIGRETFKHRYVWRKLGLEGCSERVSDGALLQETLERFLVRQAAEQLSAEIKDKRILFFCGLNRYGSAEVLSRYSKHMLFGDMLYGFRLGIPILSFPTFVNTAKRLARTVGRTPAHWFWPTARRTPPIMPRFRYYIRNADVIVGGITYFQRYMPESLEGKVVFSNVHNDAEIELFAERGARYLVSLTPVVDGVYVPLPVLEAGLKLDAGPGSTSDIESFYLGEIHRLALKPHIIDLQPEGSEDLALVELPQQALEPLEPIKEVQLSPAKEVSKFCFVIHPLSFEHVARLQIMRALRSFVPERFLEDALAQVRPWPVGLVRDVVSATGAKAEGVLYVIPMTSKAIMRFPPEFLYRRLLQVAEDAAAKGCQLMGLGAYTSVAGDAGLTVSQRSPIGVTSGNSYTVAATLMTLERAATRCGIDISRAHLLIIGATGSIGAICARMAASRVGELSLVSPRPEKLLELRRTLEQDNPQMKITINMSRDADEFLSKADGIITTTSSVEPVVDIRALKPGCLVLDVARPPDIKADVAARREDVLVIESGEVRLPEGAEVTYNIGLPKGVIYACLAETLLLALDGRVGHFTLGREIEPEKVNLIAEIGLKHGFELASIHSFGRAVPEERFARLAEINRERFEPAEVPAAEATD